jgi:hypothetical protein
MKNYKLVNTYPVAKFYYKGGHSHPVQRTVLITESNDTYIIGYEVRVGKVIRAPNAAPIKSYLRRKIARCEQLRTSMKKDYLIISKGPKVSTLKRSRLYDYLFTGP